MKKVLIILGAVIVVFLLIVPLFLPKTSVVERTIVVNADPMEVYNVVADFNYYTKWNPWSMMEPDADMKYTGTPKTVGHHWKWSGETIGKGSLTIEQLDPGKSIQSKLEFLEPMASVAKDIWKFEEKDGGTLVTWRFEGGAPYPIGRYFGLRMDKMLGGDYEKGLANIKTLVE